jgi:hypothetical protein
MESQMMSLRASEVPSSIANIVKNLQAEAAKIETDFRQVFLRSRAFEILFAMLFMNPPEDSSLLLKFLEQTIIGDLEFNSEITKFIYAATKGTEKRKKNT